MNTLRTVMRCPHLYRNITTTSKSLSRDTLAPKNMAKFKEFQRLMQVDDGVPVFLKRGVSDKLIFGVIVLSTICVTSLSLKQIYQMIYKK